MCPRDEDPGDGQEPKCRRGKDPLAIHKGESLVTGKRDLIRNALWTLASLVFAIALAMPVRADERYPIGHPDQGLPRPDVRLSPYHEDPAHVLNRIFRTTFLVTTVPAEVGLALPREHRDPAEFFRNPWYFAVRPGTPEDHKLFGGDTRLLSREGFTSGEATAFAEALAEVDGDAVRTLQGRPELAVLFQHDLLRVAERLMETRRNLELLKPIAATIKRVALTSRQILQLPSTYELGLKFRSIDFHLPSNLLYVEPPLDGAYVELLRNSTDLFDASHTLAWSRVYIAWPTSPNGLTTFLSTLSRDPKTQVPLGTISVLVQGVVAVDDQGRPHATPLVFDLRVKWLVNRNPMSVDNRTTTRDGIQIRAYELRRTSLRLEAYDHLFRVLHDEDQALFRDYGSLKHTTLAAQCALCHRLQGVSDDHLGGFITLGPSAKPRLAATGIGRMRLAEREVQQFLGRLGKAAGD